MLSGGSTCVATPRRCIYYDAVSEHYLARQAVRSGEWIRDSVVVANTTAESAVWRLEDGVGASVNMHRAAAFGRLHPLPGVRLVTYGP